MAGTFSRVRARNVALSGFAAVAVTVGAGVAAAGLTAARTPPPVAAWPRAHDGYLSALEAIDPALTRDPKWALIQGEGVCRDLAMGKNRALIVENTAIRFITSEANAARIVEVVGRYRCGPSLWGLLRPG